MLTTISSTSFKIFGDCIKMFIWLLDWPLLCVNLLYKLSIIHDRSIPQRWVDLSGIMAITMGSQVVRWSEFKKITSICIILCNSRTQVEIANNRRSAC